MIPKLNAQSEKGDLFLEKLTQGYDQFAGRPTKTSGKWNDLD